MEVIITMRLYICRAGDTCIAHNGRAAAWFKLGSSAGFSAEGESVIGAELVTHFMSGIVYNKGIAFRCGMGGEATAFTYECVRVGAAIMWLADAGDTAGIAVVGTAMNEVTD